jgi:hypothetical protein
MAASQLIAISSIMLDMVKSKAFGESKKIIL